MINVKQKLFLIDGYAFIFRAFFASPKLTTPNGIPIGAINSFVNMIFNLIEDHKIQNILVVLDKGGSKDNHRKKIYPEYKMNREAPPSDLVVQFKIMREALDAFGIKYDEEQGIEADDIIASYAHNFSKLDHEIIIISSDKDLYQLISADAQISIYDPMKNLQIDKEYVFNKLGVYPNQVKDYLALIGDTSDNIPGVKNIGPKTAADLLQKYNTLEEIYSKLHLIKKERTQKLLEAGKENAFLSQQLVELKRNIELTYHHNELQWSGIAEHSNNLQAFFEKYALRAIATRYKNNLISQQIKATHISQNNLITHSSSNLNDNTNSTQNLKLLIYTKDTKNKSWNRIIKNARYFGYVFIGYFSSSSQTKHNPEKTQSNTANNNTQTMDCIAMLIDDQYIEINDLEHFMSNHKSDIYEGLKEILSSNTIKKITYYSKEFIKYLTKYKLSITNFEDILLLSYSLGSGKYNHLYNLQNIVNEYLQTDYNYLDTYQNHLKTYQALYPILLKKLHQQQQISLYYTLDRALNPLLSQMEEKGIAIDKELLQKLCKEYEKQMSKIALALYQEANQEFNLASPKQLSHILFETMKIPPIGKKGKNGHYSTNSEVLEQLSLNGFSIADKILLWRRLFKIVNTYIYGLLDNINKDTGRIHSNFNNTLTSTGRLSSSAPNLQSIPIKTIEGNKIREAFIAPPEHSIVSADYSQIEIRILSHVANIRPLQEALQEGVDIHSLTASQVFKIPLKDVDTSWRNRAKAVNFGILYGISPFGLAQNLKISLQEAGEYIKKYFQQYPGIEQYFQETLEYVKKYEYVKTIYNRRCFIKDINSSNPTLRKMAQRAAINAPIQGSAADIIKKAMVKMPSKIKKYLVSQIHDELLFEIPKTEVNQNIKIIEDVMEKAASLKVPLLVDTKIGPSWGKAEKL